MTSAERAKEIVGEIDNKAIAAVAETMGPEHAQAVVDFLHRIERQIAQAITQAQNDKLEEAAQEMDRHNGALSCRAVAASLRSLKSKDTP